MARTLNTATLDLAAKTWAGHFNLPSQFSNKNEGTAIAGREWVMQNFERADFKDEFQHVYGKEYISSLWGYVPRAFYPKKPYSYGVTKYVTEHYYPNAGEQGHTPGFEGPVEEYLNFGLIGIVSVGFVRGYILFLFYTYFLKYRNFVGFVLLSNAMGFEIFPIVEWAPYKVLWYTVNILLLLLHRQIIMIATTIRRADNHV